MCDRVLDNESFYAFRMRKCHAKADRTAVILHVKSVARESEGAGEPIHDLAQEIESVREFFRSRPVAVSEDGIIQSDKMKPIRETGERRLEHPGRRWQSMD